MVSNILTMEDENAPSIRVQVLGGGCDVGRSCVVTTLDQGITVMFDCGVHPGYSDEKRFPDFKLIPNLDKLSLVLITHFHLDHAAALPLLTEKLGVRAPVYMTAATVALTRLMLEDFLRTSAARGQRVPFDSADVERALSRVHNLTPGTAVTPPGLPTVRITAHHAGHALGAVMFTVATDARSVVYTGDYASGAERHLPAARPPACARPQLLVTEATYCSTARRPPRRAQEDALMRAVGGALAVGGRVLVAVPALGRVQEVCAVLDAHWVAHALHNTPVYLAEGLASRANDVYERFGGAGGALLKRARPFNRAQHWHRVIGEGAPACILFATPGNLATGLSLDVFREWAPDERNLVVVPGFSFANALAAEQAAEDGPEIRCQVFNMAMSSHADAAGIRHTIEAVLPDNVMLVHGEEGKVLKFQKQLAEALGIPVLAPKNGDVVDVACPELAQRPWVDNAESTENTDNPMVQEYLQGPHACAAGFCGLGYEERALCEGDVAKVRGGLESSVGSSIEKISDREYQFMGCVLVSLIEEDSVVLVEWARPEHRPSARQLLDALDQHLAPQPTTPLPQISSEQS